MRFGSCVGGKGARCRTKHLPGFDRTEWDVTTPAHAAASANSRSAVRRSRAQRAPAGERAFAHRPSRYNPPDCPRAFQSVTSTMTRSPDRAQTRAGALVDACAGWRASQSLAARVLFAPPQRGQTSEGRDDRMYAQTTGRGIQRRQESPPIRYPSPKNR